MEVKNINSQDLEAVKQAQVAFQESIKQEAKAEVLGSAVATDSASTDSFNKLKAKVAASSEPGRAKYLEALKGAIVSGDFDPSGADIADSMFADGTSEFLF